MEKKEALFKRVRPRTATAKRCHADTELVSIECPIDKRMAAAILGVSTDTLDQWTAKYGIPHLKYDMDGNRGNRGKVLYMPSDLLEFREQFRVEGQSIEKEVEDMLAEAAKPLAKAR